MIEIGYESRDRIAYVTLNRPEAKNAVTPEMHEEMCRVWADFWDSDDADVAILTGVGDAFCAGADLATYVPINYVDAPASRVREIVDLGFGGITRGMHRIAKPMIAAVNGWALAGGLEIALACDLRVASDRAIFGSFEARRGFHHGDGGITRLVNTCGVGVAMQMVLTAEPIDAHRALQCNMVTKVVPHEQLMDEAELLARQILRNSQRAVRSAKETILEVVGKPLDDQLRIEGWNSYTCVDRNQARELLSRFFDKRMLVEPGQSRPTCKQSPGVCRMCHLSGYRVGALRPPSTAATPRQHGRVACRRTRPDRCGSTETRLMRK
jgi:enoyl-CoA hydratase/carnithine racemase